jgi:Ca2+-transporting ATPase
LALATQAWALQHAPAQAQTMVFTVLTLCQLAHAFVVRSERESLWTQGLASNRPMLATVVLTLALQAVTVLFPPLQPIFKTVGLDATQVLICLALPLVIVAAVELEKTLLRRGWIYTA